MNIDTYDSDATLDPPGTIAVVGAGPLGIEAALYGRYLGYDITLLESDQVASSLVDQIGQPIPMMPDRCVSPLGLAALKAQSGSDIPLTLPTMIDQWINEIWLPLTQTDLLRGRLRCPAQVIAIELAPVELDQEQDAEDDDQDEIPPDFRLRIAGQDPLDVEAVILATGSVSLENGAGQGGTDSIPCSFTRPADYLYQIGTSASGNAETDYWAGLKQIVAVYASLAGRDDLDLYRPDRG
ncbi:FAD-dependent oxidoreductase [Stieleria sp. TO1_6]|uniref:FAD-dependent oxidoreductase n=1 Tax=Stieleria tagensis TaxID=2956795 RepID=UPI00209AC486|nr:FAD-dependent oxidoreductase [Stieleria tagensis]MCO8123792.1 FAD-dependent oxidoreductase [Stieleria tagensis]